MLVYQRVILFLGQSWDNDHGELLIFRWANGLPTSITIALGYPRFLDDVGEP